MDGSSLKKTTFLALLSILVVIAVLVMATYAWFTNNSKVETSIATGKSGSSNMAFLIGPDEGSLVDSSKTEVEISRVSKCDGSKMKPVSTEKLSTFWYCPVMKFDKDGSKIKATKFYKDADEEYFYHGRVYIKMQGDTLTSDDKFKIYLDTSDKTGGSIAGSDSGELLSAARLGFIIGDGEPVIIKFDNGSAPTDDNTQIGGEDIAAGNVLDENGKAVADPSVELALYTLNSEEKPITIPERELATIGGNEVTEVNVYFYLEGCDSNCVHEIATNEAKLHLAFYAIAEQQ